MNTASRYTAMRPSRHCITLLRLAPVALLLIASVASAAPTITIVDPPHGAEIGQMTGSNSSTGTSLYTVVVEVRDAGAVKPRIARFAPK